MNARIRRSLAVAAALAALLALAGCRGIPTSGPVVAGPALGEADPDYVVTPNGPAAGATPEEILDGFMLAVRAPQRSYGVAEQFLSPDFQQRWQPDAGVVIRSGNATVSTAAGSTDTAPRLVYEFDSSASVDAEGRYRDAASSSHTMEFDFVQVDGEWRISSAPEDGIVLTEVAFARAFTAVPLYFYDSTERYLVPDVRWFAAVATLPTRAVSALLAGPDDWLAPAVVNEFPSGTALGTGGATVSGSQAAVDLTTPAAAASGAVLERMRQQLIHTLGVSDLNLTASGVPLSPGSDGPAPIINPGPSGAVLVGTGTDFGFGSASGVDEIAGISSVLLADGATSATLSHGLDAAVYLAGDGTARYLSAGAGASQVVDPRPGLLAPTLDPEGYIWSAAGGVGGRIDAFTPDGKSVGLDVEDLPADAGIAAIAMSRDGTRLAVLLSTGGGARLLVFAVARSAGAPTQLRSPLELPLPEGAAVGVAWADDQTLVAVTAPGDGSSHAVRLLPIGSPATDLGALGADGVVVGGLPVGQTGIRALSGGDVLVASGTGWSATGLAATFLGVQQ